MDAWVVAQLAMALTSTPLHPAGLYIPRGIRTKASLYLQISFASEESKPKTLMTQDLGGRVARSQVAMHGIASMLFAPWTVPYDAHVAN
jgi:hypothetical protein